MRISDWSSDVCSSDLLRVIDAGNYIGAGDANGIAVITQVTPIDVVFNVPQDRVGEIRARADQGVLPAVAPDRTRTTAPATGNFLIPDNQRSAARRGGKERDGTSRFRREPDS